MINQLIFKYKKNINMKKMMPKFYNYVIKLLNTISNFLLYLIFVILNKAYSSFLLKTILTLVLRIYSLDISELMEDFLTTFEEMDNWSLGPYILSLADRTPGEESGAEGEDDRSNTDESIDDFAVGPNENLNPTREDVKQSYRVWTDLGEEISKKINELETIEGVIERTVAAREREGLFELYDDACALKDKAEQELRVIREEYNLHDRLINRVSEEELEKAIAEVVEEDSKK